MGYYAVYFMDAYSVALEAVGKPPTKAEFIKDKDLCPKEYSSEADIEEIVPISKEEAIEDFSWPFTHVWKDGKVSVKEKFTDDELEALWNELGNVPVFTAEDGSLCLDEPWFIFDKGTDCEDIIWHWFDDRYSKGVGVLMNGEGSMTGMAKKLAF